MHEIEVRGPIENFDETFDFFNKNADFVEEKDRLTLVYFPKDTLDLKEMESDPRDLRLRITNKKAELVIKYGQWGVKDKRREISIPLPSEKFEDTAELLHYLGWSYGCFLATKTFVFDYKGMEFALVKNKFANYFEAEKVITDKDKSDEVLEEIESVCQKINLRLFSKEEYFEMMDKMNHGEGSIFDFRKMKFSDIKRDYSEFF